MLFAVGGPFAASGTGSKASRGTGLLVRRGSCRGCPSVAPSARSREGDGRRLRPRRWDGPGDLERDGSGAGHAVRAPRDAMGAVPGTFSRRKESQAPSPRTVDARRGRWVVAGTMSNPARPGGHQNPACPRVERDGRSYGLSRLVEDLELVAVSGVLHGDLLVVHAPRPAAVESDVKGRRRGDLSCP